MAIDTEGPFDLPPDLPTFEEPEPPPPDYSETARELFHQLSRAAGGLNEVSDALGKFISAVDARVRELNLGVSTWISMPGGWEEEDGAYCVWQVGYDKVGRQWGIAIRTLEGHHRSPDPDHPETWLFNDAPRAMRVEAADKLPLLLSALITTADETAEAIERKTSLGREFAKGIELKATKRK